MVGAGTFLNPLLKVITTVAILAASYFFIVKPVLDTTETVSGGINDSTNNISKSIKQSIKQANQQAAQQGAQGVQFEATGLSAAQAQKIQQCVAKAAGDVTALQACGELATKLTGK